MSLLTKEDRAYILSHLANAPDSVLADAMLAFNAIRDKIIAVRQMTSEVEGVIGPDYSTDVEVIIPIHPTAPIIEPKNVSPGLPTIGKIGTNTKADILDMLGKGVQPSTTKFGEHLKLLWARGEVKFDGKEYYL